jgi:hypothetical protein
MPNQPEEGLVEAPEPTSAATFGPGFFLGQLRAFARDCCPSPSETLPSVVIHLATGEMLELCHIMGLAPAFAALAIHDEKKSGGGTGDAMRTELVPYALITRITIRPRRNSGTHVGFDAGREPRVLAVSSPEETLRAMSSAPPARRRPRE